VPDTVWTVQRLLEWTTQFLTRKGVDPARLSAELLLSHVLAAPRIKLYTEFERVPAEGELARYRDLVRRAGEQEPVAYLTGTAHFFNLELEVSRDVLIPRPDTEVLVESVIRLARTRNWTAPRILDLCTGSGCVAAAIAANLKTALVTAVEISRPAKAVAQRNIGKLNLESRVQCVEGDLYGPLERGTQLVNGTPRFCVIVANPPYIRSDGMAALDRSVRDYEPAAALDGGPDGLSIHRRIWARAAEFLSDEGEVFLEIAFDQAEAALQAISEYPCLSEARTVRDYAGRDRVIAARRK
jgi:release factor glutamine methyltransferase